MIRRIVENSNRHPLRSKQILTSPSFTCGACSQGKLIIRTSFTKVISESLTFLERIQENIYGLIHPPSGPFHYFMILIDASTRWSYVSLLSTRNIAFARLLTQIIRLRVQFPDHPIKTMMATSSNHSKILDMDETSRECIWLRSMIRHI